jgi:carbon monoxide dehydrogenase subunit G
VTHGARDVRDDCTMKVQLEKSYPMPASADTGWALLQDIEGVASCMPGAKITEQIDPQHYKGTVSVKLGPASLTFRGEIEVRGIDAAARSLRLFAKGTDTTGGSAASMDLTARVEAVDATSCNLVGTSEVSMSGKAATFGGRVMGPVSDQILGQFAANFAAKVQAMQQAKAPTAASAAAAPASAAAAEPKPLNGLALMWAVIKGWFSSLFAARKS